MEKVTGVKAIGARTELVVAEMRVGNLGIFARVENLPHREMDLFAPLGGLDNSRFIDIAQDKAERAGLHFTGCFVAFLEFRACPGSEIAVPGAVNVDLGAQGLEAGFVGDDQRIHRAFRVGLDGSETRLKTHGHASFCHEVIVNPLEVFGIDGNPVELSCRDVGRAEL